ncbi:similar to Saccharomyces cerevisiae YDR405W MRP20 Mitochondrial ribosomal protein of the large subunit [Maudiozyma saulgeensis]|uniref:Large ribosomal subunit protein uL23m n=1 Tax=Maudiozyma saulgeensis TaxID=1789683 RepID=A0A1X7R315_9SACH|nr:similar to Saccharomyces cerevisiae YDR405W MRP20 Mitochondrial ribosomal protein of the large subunit [Kazachstania saulgeensis]
MPRLTPSTVPKVTNFGEKILNLTRSSIGSVTNDVGTATSDLLPHFRVGEKEIYFPKARIILLRPNAKHTPYQAKFIVPKSFNKLDLRDYLFHLYGLRALNITTQLLHGRFVRMSAFSGRFRGPQIKKMTIEMEQPFIWPEEPESSEVARWNEEFQNELNKYKAENQMSVGSDINKPSTAFDGTLGKYAEGAQPFIPRFWKSEIINKRDRAEKKIKYMEQLSKIDKYAKNNEITH